MPEKERTDTGSSSESQEERQWNHDITRALIGGAVTLAISVGLAILLGRTSAFKAEQLVGSLSGVLPYLGSAGIASASTILALMITLLSLGSNSERTFTGIFFRRILWCGRQASMLFIVCVLMLLAMAAPVAEASNYEHAATLTTVQFYLIAGLTALSTGLFVSLVSMLQSTLADLVSALGFGEEHSRLVKDQESSEPEKDDEELGDREACS